MLWVGLVCVCVGGSSESVGRAGINADPHPFSHTPTSPRTHQGIHQPRRVEAPFHKQLGRRALRLAEGGGTGGDVPEEIGATAADASRGGLLFVGGVGGGG